MPRQLRLILSDSFWQESIDSVFSGARECPRSFSLAAPSLARLLSAGLKFLDYERL
jgi:hypothetical protein